MKRYLSALVALSAVVGAGISAAPAGAATADEAWEYVSAPVGGTYTPIVGNFDGNDTTDVLWYAPGSGADTLWLFRTGQRGSSVKVSEPVSGTYRPIVGNFAGDWRDDILWYAPGSAPDYLWVANNSTARFDKTRALSVSGTYTPAVLHDWRSETTHDDIVWYAPSSSTVAVWHFGDSANAVGNAYRSNSRTIPTGSKPVVGDWDVDGISDLVWYGPGTARDARWISRADGSFSATAIAVGGTYQPVPVLGTGFDGFEPYGDSILWWGDGAAPDSYWASDGFSFQSRSGAASNASGTPLAFLPGIDLIYQPNGPEQMFMDFSEDGFVGYDVASPSGRDIGPGMKPLIGDFDGDWSPDIFWYGPGALSDEIWYMQAWDEGALDASSARSQRPSSARPAWAERITEAVRNRATRR